MPELPPERLRALEHFHQLDFIDRELIRQIITKCEALVEIEKKELYKEKLGKPAELVEEEIEKTARIKVYSRLLHQHGSPT